jgi:DNA-binding transcriptional regulator YiaG
MTADEFNRALLELGLSQRTFAAKAGVTHEAVNRWARGKKPVPKFAETIIELMRKECMA